MPELRPPKLIVLVCDPVIRLAALIGQLAVAAKRWREAIAPQDVIGRIYHKILVEVARLRPRKLTVKANRLRALIAPARTKLLNRHSINCAREPGQVVVSQVWHKPIEAVFRSQPHATSPKLKRPGNTKIVGSQASAEPRTGDWRTHGIDHLLWCCKHFAGLAGVIDPLCRAIRGKSKLQLVGHGADQSAAAIRVPQFRQQGLAVGRGSEQQDTKNRSHVPPLRDATRSAHAQAGQREARNGTDRFFGVGEAAQLQRPRVYQLLRRVSRVAVVLALMPGLACGQTGFIAVAAGVDDTIVSVLDYGATRAAGNDDTAAVVAAIAACPVGGTVFFPAGEYEIVSTTLTPGGNVSLVGEGRSQDSDGTILRRTGTAGTLIDPQGNATASISNFRLFSTGHCINADNTYSFDISNIVGTAGAGCWVIHSNENSFQLSIKNVACVGYAGGYLNNGILMSGHSLAEDIQCVGLNEGMRIHGIGSRVNGGRFEVNMLAFRLGFNAAGTQVGCSDVSINGVQCESNRVHMQAVASNSTLRDLYFHGFEAASPPDTDDQDNGVILSLNDSAVENCYFSCFAPNGAALKVAGCNGARFRNVFAANIASTGAHWSAGASVLNGNGNTFDGCNVLLHASDAVRSLITNSTRTQYLAGIDHLNAAKQGKNLRGINVSVTETETSKAVAFSPGFSGGSVDFSSFTAANTGGATLAADTYYYISTVITSAGECLGNPERSVVVGGANNSVELTCYGLAGATAYKRRIYRGTETGVYDGYYELALNTDTYTDTGAAFTVRGATPPAAAVNDNSCIEPDTNYAVLITPNWLTTHRVTSKATTGFTVDFGTAAPANAAFDYMIVR